ncbi:MAG: ATP-grasp domain-containing protein [Thiolinea sp.]
MRIWFNKTFSSISSVFRNLKAAQGVDPVTVIASHTNPSAPSFLAADECYVEPSGLMGAKYLVWCLAFCREHRIDLFWVAKEARFLGGYQDDFAQIGTKLMLVTDSATLQHIAHKGEFYRELPPEVALAMESISVKSLDEFKQALTILKPKYKMLCVKPAISVFGLGFRILDTERDSITHLLHGVEYQIPLHELMAGMGNTPKFAELLVMECLPGYEWSVDCAGHNGQLLCGIQRRKLPDNAGQLIDNNPEIQAMAERLAAHFNLTGIFNIQFKLGVNGPRLLEINTRPSGGFGMACLAGVNLAELVLKSLQNKPITVPPIQYGLRIMEVNTPVILSTIST